MSTKKNAKAKDKSFENSEDSKYVDLLDEDKPIAGQKYVCLSFVSPEDILKDKKTYIVDGNKYFNRPGPDLLESTRILAEIIHPDIFPAKQHIERWVSL